MVEPIREVLIAPGIDPFVDGGLDEALSRAIGARV
jgi:hypothetical protein